MSTVLKVQNLFKSFGGVHAVKNVSFKLKNGQLLAMIGPNGAGKSTCFNLINGQLSPDQGGIFIMGHKVNGKKPRDVWKIGVGRTFQIPSTFPSMTVLENVQMTFLSYNRQTKSLLRKVSRLYVEESMELLNLVGIADQAERACGALAYGDLKRVEMAVALANQPKLLLMDEPTAGMGSAERQGLMKLTKRIVRTRKIGVLFTEHDMKLIFDYAERIIVLNRGEVIVEGTPEEVKKNNEVKDIYLGATIP
jgi:branched-chain amino acid transport system ATP-binding protein